MLMSFINPYVNSSRRYAGKGTYLDAEIDFKYIYNLKDIDGISLNVSFFFAHMMNLRCIIRNLKKV